MSLENPAELVEDPSEELLEMFEDPEDEDFSEKDADWVDLYPDHLMFREARVDLANENVHVKNNLQSGQEGYTALISRPDISLIESQAEVVLDGRAGLSTMNYAVVDDDVFLYDGNSWEETYNPGVIDVAEIAPELYEQARKYGGEEQSYEEETGPDPVPPPEDSIFTD